MLAAVGQTHLMLAWEHAFDVFDVQVAQVLLTREDLADRARYLNARGTLTAILAHGIVPVVNENDAITTAEIRIGDNDNLSALVATAINAELLVILSDIDGLFTADPRKHPDAKIVPRVERIDDALRAAAGGSKTGLGTGGMSTKLQAAELAMRSGVTTVLANGARNNVLVDVAVGEAIGTRFVPARDPLEARKRWLLGEKPTGSVHIDAGALRALRAGRSLLAVGVRAVAGDFNPGDVIAVRGADGSAEIARGVVRFNSTDARRIAGKRSADVVRMLGDGADATLLHADELVVL
jgi:glutamate 5-kinase